MIGPVSTLAVGSLAPPCSLDEALQTWRGFAQLAPAMAVTLDRRFVELPALSEATLGWRDDKPVPLPAVGCSFVSNLEISGSGYPFHHGRYVREFVHTSDVGLQWLRRADYPDNPLTRPRGNRVLINQPVLMVFGPGSRIFGHWLLDFLPRIVIAQQLLGDRLGAFVLPLPSDTPAWVERMIQTFCGIGADQIRHYSPDDDVLICPRVCLPSFGHNGEYVLHPMVRQFYDRFGNPGSPRTKRRICLSRRSQEQQTFSAWRIFEARERMEALAVAAGFEIVQPELLGFAEQVELFRSAGCILGEHGSGMHAAVFADPGTIVATVGIFNAIQFQISAAFAHQFVCLSRLQILESVPNRPVRFTVAEDDLGGLLATIEAMGHSAARG